MVWNGGCQSVEEFYNRCVGVPVQLLPTVLGVKLAVDLDLGSRYFEAPSTRIGYFQINFFSADSKIFTSTHNVFKSNLPVHNPVHTYPDSF